MSITSRTEIVTALCSNPKIMNIIKTVYPNGGPPRSPKDFAQCIAELASEIDFESSRYVRKP
jgi:hypothetical protein